MIVVGMATMYGVVMGADEVTTVASEGNDHGATIIVAPLITDMGICEGSDGSAEVTHCTNDEVTNSTIDEVTNSTNDAVTNSTNDGSAEVTDSTGELLWKALVRDAEVVAFRALPVHKVFDTSCIVGLPLYSWIH